MLTVFEVLTSSCLFGKYLLASRSWHCLTLLSPPEHDWQLLCTADGSRFISRGAEGLVLCWSLETALLNKEESVPLVILKFLLPTSV